MKSAEQNYGGVWGQRIGFGKKPVVLAIDLVKAYVLEASPLFAQGVVAAVPESATLLAEARSVGVPVIHTTIAYNGESMEDAGAWYMKSPVLRCFNLSPHKEWCDEVAPLPGELIVRKQYASAFFGTSLASTLHAAGYDTLIMAGCSTSGCIRASAVDGVQHGFRVCVVRECVGDRHPAPHEANLFDIDSKYGDVVPLHDALAYLGRLRAEQTS